MPGPFHTEWYFGRIICIWLSIPICPVYLNYKNLERHYILKCYLKLLFFILFKVSCFFLCLSYLCNLIGSSHNAFTYNGKLTNFKLCAGGGVVMWEKWTHGSPYRNSDFNCFALWLQTKVIWLASPERMLCWFLCVTTAHQEARVGLFLLHKNVKHSH